MSEYRHFIARALEEVSGRGTVLSSDKLLAKLAELDDPLSYAGGGDGSNELYQIFIEDFPFLNNSHRLLKREEAEFSEEPREKVEGLIRWLCGLMESDAISQKSLAVSLFVLGILGRDDRLLWREFPVRVGRSCRFLEATALLIEKAQITPQAHRPAEEAYVDDFNRANADGDFVTLDKLDHYFSQCFFHNGIIRSAVRLLAYHDLDRLVRACSSISNVLIAREVCDALPSRFRFLVACSCSSLWMKFTCLSMCQSDRRQRAFSKQAFPFAVRLLRQLLDDSSSRDQFLKIYCTYPVHYPALQGALGESLTKGLDEALEAYVASIKVTWSITGRKEVADCLRAFHKKASLGKRKKLFGTCFNRWGELIDNRDDERHHFKPFQSELDYGVAAYLHEFVSDEEIEESVEKIREDITQIKAGWSRSTSDAITSFHILISKGQAFCHIIKIRDAGRGDLLSREGGYYDFFDLLNNPYLRIQYHCDWLKEKAS